MSQAGLAWEAPANLKVLLRFMVDFVAKVVALSEQAEEGLGFRCEITRGFRQRSLLALDRDVGIML